MKQNLFIVFILGVSFTALAQDTIPSQVLHEVVVKADARYVTPSKAVYRPDSLQRAAATDGLSLLALMSVPQLQVNPVQESIKTVANNDVSVFINGLPATKEDIAAIKPADVRRVEYLDFPADPRYMRASHVVNFVTMTYRYGGYTKARAKERFIVNSGEGMVYSRIACRSMEYDLVVQGEYAYSRHTGSTTHDIYHLPAGTLARSSSVTGAHLKSRDFYGAFRALWHHGEMTWRNMMAISSSKTPVQLTDGEVVIGNTASRYTSSSPSSYLNTSWNSDFYSPLGHRWTLNTTTIMDIVHNSSTDSYTSGIAGFTNHARERAWHLRNDTQVNKAFSESLTAFAGISASGSRTAINYSGSTTARNLFGQFFGAVTLGASIDIGKVSGSIDGGAVVETMDINSSRMTDCYPFSHINLQYAPDRHQMLDLWFQYASFTPGASMKSPNMLRENEVLYLAGNPDLRISRHVSSYLSYTWMPDDRLQLTAYATYFRVNNRQTAIYTPTGPDGNLLKRYENNGNYNHGQAGISLQTKLLNNRLQLSASPRLLIYRITGDNHDRCCTFTGTAQGTYYFGKFNIGIYYSLPWSYVDGDTSYRRRMPSDFSVSAGWASHGWNIELQGANLQRSTWLTSRDRLTTRYFQSQVNQHGTQYHRRVTLTVSYTISYGRHVNSHSDITPAATTGSSILH